MEIKWEKMDYIAFILLGMLTIFYGNKQLQQLVAGLYIALAIWYVYTIIYEVKRYRQQKKDINSFAECLENVKKVQRIPNDIEMYYQRYVNIYQWLGVPSHFNFFT